MRLPDGTILMHTSVDEHGNEVRHAYDPRYAREYYLRTRKLKGRRRGSDQLTPSGISYPTPKGPAKGLGSTKPLSPKARAAEQKLKAEQRKKLVKRISKIRDDLRELNERLKVKLREAAAAEAKAKRGPTAAEKAETARDSKKYRDKNQQKVKATAKKAAAKEPDKSGEPKRDSVESIHQQIDETKSRLTAAVAKLRTLN